MVLILSDEILESYFLNKEKAEFKKAFLNIIYNDELLFIFSKHYIELLESKIRNVLPQFQSLLTELIDKKRILIAKCGNCGDLEKEREHILNSNKKTFYLYA